MNGELSRGVTRLVHRLEVFADAPTHCLTPQGQTMSAIWAVDATLIIVVLLLLIYLMKFGYHKVNRIPCVHAIALPAGVVSLCGFLFTIVNSRSEQRAPLSSEVTVSDLFTKDINDALLRTAYQRSNVEEEPMDSVNKWSFWLLLAGMVLLKCSRLESPTRAYPLLGVATGVVIIMMPTSDLITEIIKWAGIIATWWFASWSRPWRIGDRIWPGPRQGCSSTSINPWTGSPSGLRNRISEWMSCASFSIYFYLCLYQFHASIPSCDHQQSSLYTVPVGIARQFGRRYGTNLDHQHTHSPYLTYTFIAPLCLFIIYSSYTIWYGALICCNRMPLEPTKANTDAIEAVINFPDPRSGQRVGIRFPRPLYERPGVNAICMLGTKLGESSVSEFQERIVTHCNGDPLSHPQQAVTLVRKLISDHYNVDGESEDSGNSSNSSDDQELRLTFSLAEHRPVYEHLRRSRSIFSYLFPKDGAHTYDTGRTFSNIWDACFG